MKYEHGVTATIRESTVSTPIVAESGVVFVVGTAPVHMVGGEVNKIINGIDYETAVESLGYSDDWEKYTLCEVMYSHYRLYQVAPVIFVNVLNPIIHKKMVAATDYDLVADQVKLPTEAIKGTLVVKAGSTSLVAGTDFDSFYDEKNLIVELIQGGAAQEPTEKLNITFDAVDPSAVTLADIIGGFDVQTKKSTGFELLDSVFPKYGIVPDLLVCPGWSHNAELAAIMDAKAEKINEIFPGALALIDIDTVTVPYYMDTVEEKRKKNLFSPNQLVCWPLAENAGKVFHMSTALAGVIASTDREYDSPAESPSNKVLKATATVIKKVDGVTKEVTYVEEYLDPKRANFLNQNGIITAINFFGGFVAWGNETACYPANSMPEQYFINISRVLGWYAKTVILTTWKRVDRNLNRRRVEAIVDTISLWTNGLKNADILLGGTIEFRSEENTEQSLLAGKAVYHHTLGASPPMKHIEHVIEYDSSYLPATIL